MKILLLLISVFFASAHAQSAGNWYPSSTSHYIVKNATYDLRTSFSQGQRITFQFVNEPTKYFHYYFTATDQTQLTKANVFYSTLLTAISTSMEISVLISGPDGGSTTQWAITSISLGPQ